MNHINVIKLVLVFVRCGSRNDIGTEKHVKTGAPIDRKSWKERVYFLLFNISIRCCSDWRAIRSACLSSLVRPYRNVIQVNWWGASRGTCFWRLASTSAHSSSYYLIHLSATKPQSSITLPFAWSRRWYVRNYIGTQIGIAIPSNVQSSTDLYLQPTCDRIVLPKVDMSARVTKSAWNTAPSFVHAHGCVLES